MAVLVKLIANYSHWLYLAGVLGILIYLRVALLARRERARSVFTLEKETATGRTYRALMTALGIAFLLGLIFVNTALIAPSLDVPAGTEETPMVFLIPTATPSPLPPTEMAPPVATGAPLVTSQPIDVPTTPPPSPPTNTPAPAPACPNSQVCITSPSPDAIVSGAVQIVGSASIGNFQYYKVEFGPGENPVGWSVVTDLHHSPVAGGLLDVWDTTFLEDGAYKIRLVVVDKTGNFPPPHEVRVIVQH